MMISHRLCKDRLYSKWCDIKSRCYNKNREDFERYGGRGITICDEWKYNFKAFHDHVITLPNYAKEGYTLDRENNDEGYKPGNLRWASPHDQANNRRVFRINKSGYSGVSYNKEHKKWQANITVRYKFMYLGRYHTIKEALEARNKYIIDNDLTEYKIQQYND